MIVNAISMAAATIIASLVIVYLWFHADKVNQNAKEGKPADAPVEFTPTDVMKFVVFAAMLSGGLLLAISQFIL